MKEKIKGLKPTRQLDDDEELDFYSVHRDQLHKCNSVSKIEVKGEELPDVYYLYRKGNRVYIDHLIQDEQTGHAKCCQTCHQLVRHRTIVESQEVIIYAKTNY